VALLPGRYFGFDDAGGEWLSGHHRFPVPAVVQRHGKVERINTCVEARVGLQA